MAERDSTRARGQGAVGRSRYLSSSEARAILGFWAAWGAATLLFASAAMTLPVANGSPWTAVAHAPPLARWDSVWYRSVAVDGYRIDPSSRENNVGFYPLYPLAAKTLSAALGLPLLPVGIALSLLCLLAALLLMGDLFAEWGGEGAGFAGSVALLFYPTAFFLAAFYTESMFLLCTAAAIWGARRGRWLVVALGGSAGTLTRFNGLLLLIPIAVSAWSAIRGRPESNRVRPIAALAAVVASGCLYPAYLWHRWGDPLLYVHSKIEGWPVRPAPPWTLLAQTGREAWSHLTRPGEVGLVLGVELASIAFLLLATAFLFRRQLWPEAAYASATLLLLLSSGTHSGVARYTLGVFPCFFPFAEWLRRRPPVALSYAFCGAGINVILLHRFVHWIFVG